MATMRPDVPLDEIQYSSERDVYQALRDQLPKSYTVLHSLPWLRPDRGLAGEPLREGEADFVILHPDRGMLILEVKGGEVVLEQRSWFQRHQKTGTLRKITDPFEQGRRNMHALLDHLESRSWVHRNDWGMVYGYAVAFPHHNYTGALPANADKAVIIGQRDCENLQANIEKAFAAWTGRPSSLSPQRYQLLLNILMPRFKLIRPLGPDLAEATRRIFALTDEQQAAFAGLYENHRVLIEGAAGSGKTILAIQRALAYAQQGLKCLFVCFNVELAKWLREELKNDPTHAAYAERVDIWNYHALARDLARRANVPFKIPADPADGPAFWDEEVPDILEQAATVLRPAGECLFDAIVIDEAQDFCELWWYSLTDSFLEDPENGPVYAFFDPNQHLRKTAAEPPLNFATRYKLSVNCRNTQQIARTGAAIIKSSVRVLDKSPLGQPPVVLLAESAAQQKRVVLHQLQRLLSEEKLKPGQIALIGRRRKENGSLADVQAHVGVPLVTSAEEWRQGKGVLVTTTRSFKGLEADVVLLYDLQEPNEGFTESDLYVACTRARFLLVIVVRDQNSKQLIEEAVASK